MYVCIRRRQPSLLDSVNPVHSLHQPVPAQNTMGRICVSAKAQHGPKERPLPTNWCERAGCLSQVYTPCHTSHAGCPPNFFETKVPSLLRKMGTGEALSPACSWATSCSVPLLNPRYTRLPFWLNLISACVYCLPANWALLISSLMAS